MEMVVLSTSKAISDLLDQRSAIYSDKVGPPRLEYRISFINHPFSKPSTPMTEL